MIPTDSTYRPGVARRQYGFSLVELSVVLIVIGLIIGAVAIGRDLQRSAAYQRMSTDFIQGWQLAYEAYVNGVGYPPGDKPSSPTGQVNGNITLPARSELCGTDMINAFLAAGIQLPAGRTEGQQDRYVYLDSNGNPQEARVCFRNVHWSEPGASVGNYVVRPRNVMVIHGLTFSMLGTLEQQIDGRTDARFGSLRESSQADKTTAASVAWSIDDRYAYGDSAPSSLDESQVAVTTAYYRMMR